MLISVEYDAAAFSWEIIIREHTVCLICRSSGLSGTCYLWSVMIHAGKKLVKIVKTTVLLISYIVEIKIWLIIMSGATLVREF